MTRLQALQLEPGFYQRLLVGLALKEVDPTVLVMAGDQLDTSFIRTLCTQLATRQAAQARQLPLQRVRLVFSQQTPDAFTIKVPPTATVAHMVKMVYRRWKCKEDIVLYQRGVRLDDHQLLSALAAASTTDTPKNHGLFDIMLTDLQVVRLEDIDQLFVYNGHVYITVALAEAQMCRIAWLEKYKDSTPLCHNYKLTHFFEDRMFKCRVVHAGGPQHSNVHLGVHLKALDVTPECKLGINPSWLLGK